MIEEFDHDHLVRITRLKKRAGQKYQCYQFGDSKKKVAVIQKGSLLMCRVGGGWMEFGLCRSARSFAPQRLNSCRTSRRDSPAQRWPRS